MKKTISVFLSTVIMLSLFTPAFATEYSTATNNELDAYIDSIESGDKSCCTATIENENGTQYEINVEPISYYTIGDETTICLSASTDNMKLTRIGSESSATASVSDGKVSLMGLMSDTFWDPTTSVSYYLCLTYTTNLNMILLTNVSGSYSISQSGVQVTNNNVRYTCTNIPSLVQQIDSYAFDTWSFSKNTNFTNYVVCDNSTSWVGAVWDSTLTRGSTTWSSSVMLYRYGGV